MRRWHGAVMATAILGLLTAVLPGSAARAGAISGAVVAADVVDGHSGPLQVRLTTNGALAAQDWVRVTFQVGFQVSDVSGVKLTSGDKEVSAATTRNGQVVDLALGEPLNAGSELIVHFPSGAVRNPTSASQFLVGFSTWRHPGILVDWGSAPIHVGVRGARLVIVTPHVIAQAGQRSQKVKVELRNQAGATVVTGQPVTVNLVSTAPNGKFYAGAEGGDPITSVTIPAEGSQASFYYEDTTAGKPILIVQSPQMPHAGTDVQNAYILTNNQ